jgi:hypothetical protein
MLTFMVGYHNFTFSIEMVGTMVVIIFPQIKDD